MQKSWYILSECQQKDEYTDEYNEKMKFYEKICAHKKPYFFGYNYSSLMKEYRETTNKAITNARQKFRMELDDMLRAYENNEYLPEEQRIFVERFLHSLKLDSSKSTCNMICWEIENIFDNNIGFAPNKTDLYALVRRNEESNPSLLDKIVNKLFLKMYAIFVFLVVTPIPKYVLLLENNKYCPKKFFSFMTVIISSLIL